MNFRKQIEKSESLPFRIAIRAYPRRGRRAHEVVDMEHVIGIVTS
jgi:hypothetical protein